MKLQQRFRNILAKAGTYKYTALILLLGIGLMLMPQGEKRTVEQEAEPQQQPAAESLEERLEIILRQMDGVGEVDVLLTLETGMAYEYQTDDRVHTQQEESEVQKETVLVGSGSGKDQPVTVKTTYPTYQGALVLCQGADRAAVRLDIVNAVSDLTGLGSDKISVIKMKDN